MTITRLNPEYQEKGSYATRNASMTAGFAIWDDAKGEAIINFSTPSGGTRHLIIKSNMLDLADGNWNTVWQIPAVGSGLATSDANNYKTEGRYVFNTGNTMANMPSGCGQYGVLHVFTDNSNPSNQWFYVLQVCMSTNGSAWMRIAFDGSWYGWRAIT